MQYKEKYSLSLEPKVTFLSSLLFNASAIALALKLNLRRKVLEKKLTLDVLPLLQVLSRITFHSSD